MALTLTQERRDDGVAVLHMTGRLDASSVGDFEEGVLPLANDPAVSRLILACAGLEYVASAGLRVLVGVIKTLSARKAKLCAAELRPETLAVLKMTGFMSFIEVKETVDECLG